MKAVAAISFVVMIAGVSTGCQTLTGRTAKEHFNDKWLTHETKATIVARNANALTAVDVDVNRGVVYLTGTVPTAEHKALAREIAEQSTVLLKNEGVLPLADDAPTVAVIGQTASATATAGVSAKTGCAWYLVFARSTALNCDAIVDPLTGITERVEQAGGEVLYANGADLAQASAVAAQADVAIVFGHYTMGETTDLADLHLDANGDALVEAVAAASDRTVAVINAGSAVEMPWIDDVDAVLHAWHSGEQFGPALASLLWGDVNPSGKLPMTFPVSLADTPTNTPEQYPGVFSDGSTTRPAGITTTAPSPSAAVLRAAKGRRSILATRARCASSRSGRSAIARESGRSRPSACSSSAACPSTRTRRGPPSGSASGEGAGTPARSASAKLVAAIGATLVWRHSSSLGPGNPSVRNLSRASRRRAERRRRSTELHSVRQRARLAAYHPT